LFFPALPTASELTVVDLNMDKDSAASTLLSRRLRLGIPAAPRER
jgi:hypothetical protein